MIVRDEHGRKVRVEASCPHAQIYNCPLYYAGHYVGNFPGFGCVDDLALPCLVARLKFREEAEEMRAQRARNMRAAGIQ